MSVLDMMTPEQREKSKESMAMTQCQLVRHPMGEHPVRQTGHFHLLCEIPTPEAPIIPSVTSREQRLAFILEEFLELVEACGCGMTLNGESINSAALKVEHIEGTRYDVVEAADALSDLNVVNNGTAVEWGIPVHVTDYEVYSSNLTKILPDGTVIRNGVTEGYREGEPGHQPNRPDGKICKPVSFIPANIPAALVAFERKEF